LKDRSYAAFASVVLSVTNFAPPGPCPTTYRQPSDCRQDCVRSRLRALRPHRHHGAPTSSPIHLVLMMLSGRRSTAKPGHCTTRRSTAATGVPMGSLLKVLVSFATTVRLENVHPLQSGVLRLKHPSERRPGLPRERAWVFWPRFVWETLYKHVILAGVIARLLVLK